jgi:hypothetical protein
MVISAVVPVVMVTSLVASVVRALKVVETAHVVRSLRHHQNFHSVRSQSASSHAV